jgi:multimeric flavodoxin WrbA
MKIVMLNGSPHKDGATSLLAERFTTGATEAGHDVYRFDGAFRNVHPCLGCDVCGMNGPCVHKDDIEKDLIGRLVSCDMVVLVSPLYYSAFSGQLKTLIDRFYSRTESIHHKKSAILVACAGKESWSLEAIEAYYKKLTNYMEWQDTGRVMATGCPDRAAIEKTNFPQAAYDLGKKL